MAEHRPISGGVPEKPKKAGVWESLQSKKEQFCKKPELAKATNKKTPTELATEQVNAYLAEPCLDNKEDPLLFWRVNQSKWPEMAKVARKYLTCPPSSVSSERIFKVTSDICVPDRNKLLPENVDRLLFLKYNLRALNYDSFSWDPQPTKPKAVKLQSTPPLFSSLKKSIAVQSTGSRIKRTTRRKIPKLGGKAKRRALSGPARSAACSSSSAADESGFLGDEDTDEVAILGGEQNDDELDDLLTEGASDDDGILYGD